MKVVHLINRREGITLEGLKRLHGHTWIDHAVGFLRKQRRNGTNRAWIFLHPVSKSEPSEFGGIITGFEPAKREPQKKTEDGFAFIFEAKKNGKGQPWPPEGANHNMAWNSGIIDVADFEDE